MGVFSGGRTERRYSPFPYPAIPSNAEGGSVNVRNVNLARADSALQKVAVFAAVNLLASIAEMLPGDVYRGYGGSKAIVKTPDWLLNLDGVKSASDSTFYGLNDFLWQVMYCWCLRGNVVGQILERDSKTGAPRSINLLYPDDVDVSVLPGETRAVWRYRGKLIPASDVWHKRVYPVPGRVLGLSPIAQHAVTVAQGLYAQNFGAQWFLDGAHPSAILQNQTNNEIDQPVAQAVKARFMAALAGNREPVVLGKGWEYKQIQIAPGESQFLETQQWTAAECARIYGPGMPEILGYDVGKSMTYANIGQRAVDLLKYTVDPWLVRLERVISDLLPNSQYYKFDRAALLQTDMLTRFQIHEIGLRTGLNYINEVRRNEDMMPVDWGDAPYSLPKITVRPSDFDHLNDVLSEATNDGNP